MPIRRVGRPGLIGTAARTAVIAGTATAVSGKVARHQQQKAYDQQAQQAQQAPPPPPAPAPAPAPPAADPTAELQKLASLHQQGLITDDEYAQAKAKVLGL